MGTLPLILTMDGKAAVVVGGGPVARRRATSLAEAGARVTLIAPCLRPPDVALPASIRHLPRTYDATDLTGAFLVVAATDDPAINEQIQADAQRTGVLLNRADAPDAGDVRFPARASVGPVELSVHTGGISADAARRIAGELAEALAPHWPALLEAAAPFRRQIQELPHLADAPARRQALLKRLTDPQAMAMLVDHGIAGLAAHYQQLLSEAGDRPPA